MKRLINNEDLSDIIFVVEGRNVYASKAPIAGPLCYFRGNYISPGASRGSLRTFLRNALRWNAREFMC